MGWHESLLLWCAVWGAAAVVGVGMSLAGVTKAQRTVRLTGRIQQVRAPRHGGGREGGISVVVSYRDPASGQDVVVTNDGERGEMITAAWEGREIGVSHPRGRPHAYRFSNVPEKPTRGLGLPSCAAFLVYVGLVVLAAVDWGWPWALIGSGGPLALLGAVQLPGAVRARNDRLGRLAAMETVRGRIVAVLKDVSVDEDDGHTRTTITPVVSFTTREGTAVTAHCTSSLPDPAGAYGRDVTVHYPAADPAGFTLDPAAEHRSEKWDVRIHALAIVVLAVVTVVGVVFLRA
ncbi:DUF3592 domain-containing protein [Kitasatospora sp. NPDC008115]|uniref:DUF3592 domain-containing protein n=1 Tax=Kitasatospora sp. NPDC008115 TaxID=3364022 RepID=UPI0036EC2F7E